MILSGMRTGSATEIPEAVLMDSRATDRMASRSPQLRVIARTERRRFWSAEQKRAIVAESFAGCLSVSAVARKHEISPGQLFTWRRQMLTGDLEAAAPLPPRFARVELLPSPSSPDDSGRDERQDEPGGGEAISAGSSRIGVMEIILADVTIRVDASVEEVALRRVLTALGR
jgi:transposase